MLAGFSVCLLHCAIFTRLDSITLEGRWKKAEGPREVTPENALNCGETAGITCLTLQPVLALVSMNMTFSSLALCSPSSIIICLQEKAVIQHYSVAPFDTVMSAFSWLKGASRHRLRCEHRLMTRSPLLLQVGFVPDKHDDDVTSSLRPDIVDPFAGLLEWVHICGVQTPFISNSLLLGFQIKKNKNKASNSNSLVMS